MFTVTYTLSGHTRTLHADGLTSLARLLGLLELIPGLVLEVRGPAGEPVGAGVLQWACERWHLRVGMEDAGGGRVRLPGKQG